MTSRISIFALFLCAVPGLADDRPNEADLFGAPPAVETPSADASTTSADESTQTRDDVALGAPAAQSRFDTSESTDDPLKLGATLNIFTQALWMEKQSFEDARLSIPFILDAFIDGRPTDRLRAFALARLQFDPTVPSEAGATATSTSTSTNTSLVGLTPGTRANPSIALDQLWLRYDVARVAYFTVGRQKIRWGTSRIWYPTDFLNARPRDALNPFDVRLGVNALKVHVPVESLGWNFYGYGLLDTPNATSPAFTLEQLGGALRAEIVLGPAELGVGGVWRKGRRPRYAIDVSSSLGPVDVYAEAAFRDGRDFLLFRYPSDLRLTNLASRFGEIDAYRPSNILVQTTAGISWQFNYTDSNFAVVGVEYFNNPAGYADVTGYQVMTFGPRFFGEPLADIQQLPLYGAQHNVAVSFAMPGLPGLPWITASLANIIIVSDPSALSRVDLTFRVLQQLQIQCFASVFYGRGGGQLKFQLDGDSVEQLAQLSDLMQPGSGAAVRESASALRDAPLLQAGLVLRLAI